MRTKTLFLACLVLIAVNLKAQLSMTLQVPPVGVLQKGQLWNMLLVKASAGQTAVIVKMTLLDPRTNQVLLTATTRTVTLANGANQLQSSTFSPIQYDYNAGIFNADRTPDGLLPAGTYLACYTVSTPPYQHSIILAENCIEVNVSPLSPPLLNTPADKGTVNTVYPQFTWLPPTPVNLFNDLSYDFILTEVLNGQSSTEAIQQNVPVFSQGNYRDNFYNYASSNKSLDTGRLYAWRVVARNNNNIVAQSDIWTFKPALPVIKPSHSDIFYTRLEKGLGAAVVVCKDVLRFQYNNWPGDKNALFTITRIDDGRNTVVERGAVDLSPGENLKDVAPGKNTLEIGKLYLFELINGRNEHWSIKFLYSPDKQNLSSN